MGFNENSAVFSGFFYNGASDAALRGGFVEALLDGEGSRVVDISCGVGDLAFHLAAAGHYVTCFEPSRALFSTLLERHRLRKEVQHLVSLFPVAIEDCPLPLHADLAVASNVFSHLCIEEKELKLRAMHARLRHGGRIVFNCIQKTPLRPAQPLSEIGKRVFGEMVIRHFASSTPSEDGESQHIHFEYRMEFRGERAAVLVDDFTLYMDRVEGMSAAVGAAGFRDVQVFGSYEGNPPHEELPGFVVVASKR